MKKQIRIIAAIFIAGLFTAAFMTSSVTYAQAPPMKIKIGTYDSRVAVFAWSRTDGLKQFMKKISQETDSATKNKDTLKVKEVSIKAMSFQHLLHQVVFSTGSAASFVAVIKEKLPELAKKEGVSIIVSKYELNYSDPSIEIIDLTRQVAALFQPKEDIDKMITEIMAQPPYPIEELSIETDMLDLYAKRFPCKSCCK
jgi:hypothetical protein